MSVLGVLASAPRSLVAAASGSLFWLGCLLLDRALAATDPTYQPRFHNLLYGLLTASLASIALISAGGGWAGLEARLTSLAWPSFGGLLALVSWAPGALVALLMGPFLAGGAVLVCANRTAWPLWLSLGVALAVGVGTGAATAASASRPDLFGFAMLSALLMASFAADARMHGGAAPAP